MKFKVGDTVRCIDDNAHGIYNINQYIVVSTSHNGEEDIITIKNGLGKQESYKARRFELVTQAMPTPEEVRNDYDYIMLRNGSISDSETEGEFRNDLTHMDVKDYDIMVIYKQNGYELDLIWSRPEEKTKEIEKVDEIGYGTSEGTLKCIHKINELVEAINILKHNK